MQGKAVEGCHPKCSFRFCDSQSGAPAISHATLGSAPQHTNRNTALIHASYKGWWAKRTLPVFEEYRVVAHRVYLHLSGSLSFHPPRLPKFYAWLPKFRFADVVTQSKELLPVPEVQRLADMYLNRLRRCPEFMRRVRTIEPLSEHETLHGIKGSLYVKRMNFKSSAGFPYNKAKEFVLTCYDSVNRFFSIPDGVKTRIEGMRQRGREKKFLGIFFTAQIKDEATKEGKLIPPQELCDAEGNILKPSEVDPQVLLSAIRNSSFGKLRIFQAVNFEALYIIREQFLVLVSLLQEFNFLSCIAVGTNCFGKDWDLLYRHMTPLSFSDNDVFRFICGDFSNYDQRIGASWLRAAWGVLIELLSETIYFKNLPASEKEAHQNLWWSIADGVANPFTWFFGDLLQLDGSNPSGHPLTVIINGIVNYMYMAYAFAQIYPERAFDECIRLMTYGDDNMLTVRPDCLDYNQVSITRALAQIGIIYTNSDKSAAQKEFESELTFLKRTWSACSYVVEGVTHQFYTCPLDFASIGKMLSTESARHPQLRDIRIINVLTGAMFEHIQYGRREYEHFKRLCDEFVDEHDLGNVKTCVLTNGWPDYDQYMLARCVDGNVFAHVDTELPRLGELDFE
jgi:hypothetical protein